MDGETDILQDRVEVLALGRRRVEAQERVGGQQDEGEEGRRRSALHAQHIGAQVGGRLPPKIATRRAKSDRISSQSSIEPS